jgi:hypothetical protein
VPSHVIISEITPPAPDIPTNRLETCIYIYYYWAETGCCDRREFNRSNPSRFTSSRVVQRPLQMAARRFAHTWGGVWEPWGSPYTVKVVRIGGCILLAGPCRGTIHLVCYAETVDV